MSQSTRVAIAAVSFACCSTAPLFAQWVEFVEEPERLVAPDNLGAGDVEEKDYAWGDVDLDGDIDLVCVRKQPFTSPGAKPNVLLMNEDGVLTDRTLEYASASDVPGDMGFLTPTNDRDVALVDVDGDGWLDIVTATTLSDNLPKHISHPRVYMNLGEISGVWQGFEYQDLRIPQMHPTAGPRFCSVAAGDVTGDGAPDLYFGDYDSGGTQIYDFNNRLLINDGNGFFTDQTATRLTSEMSNSAFGAASVIADINGDGVMDVVKQTSLTQPLHVAVTYNDPLNEGFFDRYDIVYDQAPYFVSAGDLNSDGLLDLVITDDGTDRYMLNTGNDPLGQAMFAEFTLQSSGGFGSNSVIADLNKDGHNDIIVADVDVDIPGCSRTTKIYRNLGNLPNVSFQIQGMPIPDSALTGVHDVAVFDLNGDQWPDLVIGRCSGTQIWINQPPSGLLFSYPDGLPGFVVPNQSNELLVQVQAIGGGVPQPDSGRVSISVNDGPFDEAPMTALGANLYLATLPPLDCTEKVEFYFTAELADGTVFNDPQAAPQATFSAIAASGTTIFLRDELEGNVSSWTVLNDPSLTAGGWEVAEPNGTLFNGKLAAPNQDATAGTGNVRAFVTKNGLPNGSAADSDVDGGPTHLLSPVLNLEGTDALISYDRWFFSDGSVNHVPDHLTVDVSNDGGSEWVSVLDQTTGGTNSAWQTAYFRVSDYVEPTSAVRVRFSTSDSPNDSVTEAGIDNFQVEIFDCPAVTRSCCFGDGACFELPVGECTAQGGTPITDPGVNCATDTDGDGTPDCGDGCPADPDKIDAGSCGCGVPDDDTDNDGTPDCLDGCPADPDKIDAGSCGCGVPDDDTDNDGTPDCLDGCPDDPDKTDAGTCGCGVPDDDSDGDGSPDCLDGCPNDPDKTDAGTCGCGVPDDDSDGDGSPDCLDGCPNDPDKTDAGVCGCGVPDDDTDNDGTPDCLDGCPDDPDKTDAGTCGCGVPDDDTDNDGTPDCLDPCPGDENDLCVPQACCLADGSCMDLTAQECDQGGGTAQGVDTACAGIPCPPPTGSCCFSDGSCLDTTEVDCSAGEGAFQGGLTDCASTTCPSPNGACCFGSGSCEDLASDNCAIAGGVFAGPDSVCAEWSCPEPSGACCFDDGSCLEDTAAGCADAAGTYHGDRTICEPLPCSEVMGACCLVDAGCEVMSKSACQEQNGVYVGDATSCEPESCPEVAGACCLPDGTCGEQSVLACDQAAGAYQGNGSSCASTECPTPVGACCRPEGSCSIEPEATCDLAGGAYSGHGTACQEVVCQPASCPGDLDGDQVVSVLDLIELIVGWGSCEQPPCAADINNDGLVDVQDLVSLIVNWGSCP